MLTRDLNLQEISLAVILSQALRVEAPGFHPFGANELPKLGGDFFIPEYRVRVYQIDADPYLGQFQRSDLGNLMGPGFRGTVRPKGRPGIKNILRVDDHDVAACPLPFEYRDGSLDDMESSPEIDGHDLIELLRVELFDPGDVGNAGVRYDKIQAAEPSTDFDEGFLHGFVPGHIENDAFHPTFAVPLGQDGMHFL